MCAEFALKLVAKRVCDLGHQIGMADGDKGSAFHGFVRTCQKLVAFLSRSSGLHGGQG